MKKQKIKRGDFYGEPIFNLNAYAVSRNYAIGQKNSKRAERQYLALVDYLQNYKARQKKVEK